MKVYLQGTLHQEWPNFVLHSNGMYFLKCVGVHLTGEGKKTKVLPAYTMMFGVKHNGKQLQIEIPFWDTEAVTTVILQPKPPFIRVEYFGEEDE